MLTKKEAEEIMHLEGEVRTVTLCTDAASVVRLKGKDGLNRVEAKLQSLGHPIDYGTMRAMDWRPLGLRVLSLLVIKDTFEWGDGEIRAMGYAALTYSLVTRLFMKTLASPDIAFGRAPIYWSSHFTSGKMEVEFVNGLNRVSFLIREFGGHPVLCKHIEGYLERAGQFIMPKHNVRLRETKCPFQGEPYHQYDLSW